MRAIVPRHLYFILQLPLLLSFIVGNIIFSIIHFRSRFLGEFYPRQAIELFISCPRIRVPTWQFLLRFISCPSWCFHFNIWHPYLASVCLVVWGLWRTYHSELADRMGCYLLLQTLFCFICCQFTSHFFPCDGAEATIFVFYLLFPLSRS